MKKIGLYLMVFATALLSYGCLGQPIQSYLIEPRAFVKGKVAVPPGKDPLGVKVQVAGKDASVKYFENPYFTYADENGNFSLELRNGGRYLLFARGRDFNINYGWVDAILEQSVTATDITLTEKVMGEALFMASLVDLEEVDTPTVCIKAPETATGTFPMYDDGTHGDRVPGDKVWTCLLNGLTSGRIEYKLKNKGKEITDTYQEMTLNENSVINVKPSQVRQVQGDILLLNSSGSERLANFQGLSVSCNRGTRSATVNSDGTFQLPISGPGKVPLVFKGSAFEKKAILVDVSSEGNVVVPTVVLQEKKTGEARFIVTTADFPGMTTPKILGDFSSYAPVALYDDGTHGDEVAGDGVFTLLSRNLTSGILTYQIMPFDLAMRDPYEEGSADVSSTVLVR